jgi:transglutaminase-like putative cysteine protease
VALAREAIGDARAPAEQVARLVRFVARFVEDAWGADALSVLQVIERRRGDCSEHAALFTTLARAAGIPARTVSGLAWLGDEARAFGGHAWCEVALDGAWVPVDPTLDQVRIDAAHVRLGHEGGPDASLRVHGRLRLVLLDAEREE